MWVVGLGNPGPRYAATRHNAGQAVLHRLVDHWKATPLLREPSFAAYGARLSGPEAIAVALVAPLSMMNRSGQALADFEHVSGTKLDPARTLVVCDDVYLPVGALRVRARGSTGGHRGLESVEAFLGTPGYARLRIGVGPVEAAELVDHVLSHFAEDEREPFAEALGRAEEAVETWVREGVLAAMNRFNRRSDDRPSKEVSS